VGILYSPASILDYLTLGDFMYYIPLDYVRGLQSVMTNNQTTFKRIVGAGISRLVTCLRCLNLNIIYLFAITVSTITVARIKTKKSRFDKKIPTDAKNPVERKDV
jgi:hypothetical protein